MVRLRLVEWGGVEFAIEQAAAGLPEIKQAIGVQLVALAQERFATQGNPPESWPERMTPNFPGALEDLKHSSRVREHRFVPRPAGVDQGFGGGLVSQIGWEDTGPFTLEVGVYGPAQEYADVVYFGGESKTDPVTKTQIDNVFSFLRGKLPGSEEYDLAWLANDRWVGAEFTIDVQPRPFLDFDDEELDGVAETIKDRMFGMETEVDFGRGEA